MSILGNAKIPSNPNISNGMKSVKRNHFILNTARKYFNKFSLFISETVSSNMYDRYKFRLSKACGTLILISLSQLCTRIYTSNNSEKKLRQLLMCRKLAFKETRTSETVYFDIHIHSFISNYAQAGLSGF